MIQLKLAKMEVARMHVQNMVFQTLERLKAGKLPALGEASAIKWYSSEAATDVAMDAVQLFGGNGYMAEYRRLEDCGGEVDEPILEFDRRIDGAPGVVGSNLWDTPYGHEPVADVLGDPCPVSLGSAAEDAVIPTHDVARGLRADLLLEAR